MSNEKIVEVLNGIKENGFDGKPSIEWHKDGKP